MTAHLPRVKTRLSIHAHRKVRGLLEGEYASLQTGRSMDFNDLRAYVRGDDVKDLDWKASARSGALLVKRYAAVRKHTVLLAVSTGRSMAAMNDLRVPKRDLAVFVAGVMGFLAVKHGDHVGLAYGDAERQHVIPPASGELALERFLGTVHGATTPSSAGSDLTAVLGHVSRTVRRRAILVVVSDELGVDDALEAVLRRLSVQHEVLFLTIGDLPPTVPESAHRTQMYDVDSDAEVPAWVRDDAQLRREYDRMVADAEAGTKRRLDALGIVHERVHDDPSAIAAVFRLLERHRHARR